MLKKLIIISGIIIFLVIAIMAGVWWLANSMSDKIVPVVNPPIATSSPVIATTTIVEPAVVSSTTSTIPVEEKPVVEIATSSEPQELILIPDVPFTIQAPSGEWSDPMQQDGCEEASVLMAMYWYKDLKLDKATAKKEILAMGDYQLKNYTSAVDTDVYDTVERLFIGYWKFTDAQIDARLSKAKIISALKNNQLVLVPTNGQLLNNPNYKAPGPLTHMLVIKGYDPVTDEFITNDSGTRKGEGYHYPAVTLLKAVVTYPTGDHGVQDITKKSMIIVSR